MRPDRGRYPVGSDPAAAANHRHEGDRGGICTSRMQDAPRFQSQSNTTHPAGWAASAAAARVPGSGGNATQPAAPGRVSGMSTPPTLLPLPQPGETPVRVLTVAGSDSGGGAGLQADLRTMALLGVHGCTAVTAVTVQNTLGVTGVHEVPADTVAAQVRAVVYDIGVGAVKTGMLASTPIITALAEVFAELGIGKGSHVPLVLDPVAASVTGDPLFTGSAQNALTRSLFPLATLLTPNSTRCGSSPGSTWWTGPPSAKRRGYCTGSGRAGCS